MHLLRSVAVRFFFWRTKPRQPFQMISNFPLSTTLMVESAFTLPPCLFPDQSNFSSLTFSNCFFFFNTWFNSWTRTFSLLCVWKVDGIINKAHYYNKTLVSLSFLFLLNGFFESAHRGFLISLKICHSLFNLPHLLFLLYSCFFVVLDF